MTMKSMLALGIPSSRISLVAMALLIPIGVMARAEEVTARFHHVRLNSTDPTKSMRYYQKHLGAVPIRFDNRTDALFVERSFLLFNKVDEAPSTALVSGIWHIGWGGVDIVHEYEWLKRAGVEFHTPPTPLPGKDNFYMYLKGPMGELIEINTMGHHRFAHVHFFCDDVNATCDWYRDHLGLKPRFPRVNKPKGNPNTIFGIWMNIIPCDNVILIFFGKPDHDPKPTWWPDEPLKEIQPTKGRAIDHLAFSYSSLAPVHDRMKSAGLTIDTPLSTDDVFGFRRFTVVGPDNVLIEIVESKPIPEGIWDQ